jgi:hypothetical protein
MDTPTRFLLLRVGGDADSVRAAASRLAAVSPVPLVLHRIAWSAALGEGYVYGRLPAGTAPDRDVAAALEHTLAAALPPSASPTVSRLESKRDRPGRSCDRVPTHHYVVETDTEQGWADEFVRWYDEEHLPGLAAVPGCVRGMRLLSHDRGPWSFACYDLDGEDTFGSPPWLAVRATDWSARVRPHFRNTKRTMFAVLG